MSISFQGLCSMSDIRGFVRPICIHLCPFLSILICYYQQGVLLGLSNTAGVLAGVLGTAATGYILQHGIYIVSN